jgi:phosphonate transport system substrate-binding protein
MSSFSFTRLLALSISLLLCCTACSDTERIPIDLHAGPPQHKPAGNSTEKPLRLVMGAKITPKEGFSYYQRLQSYLAKKLGRPIELVERESYGEVNRLLVDGGADVAFVCSGPYVKGKASSQMELLVMPVGKGEPSYYSYIIVPADSPFRTFKDLRGKRFAFNDPLSNTGTLVPTHLLASMGETPSSFFDSYVYTYGHDTSIKAVADKLVDGAAVDSLIWNYLAVTTPRLTRKTRIISKSGPYGIPPVVVRPGLDPGLKRRLAEIFMSAADDPEGKPILDGMMIDKFIPGVDSNYDSIRRMYDQIPSKRLK